MIVSESPGDQKHLTRMKILITYYSMYGHVFKMAKEAEAALRDVPGIEPVLRKVQEFDTVTKVIEGNEFMSHVRDLQKDVPVVTLEDLKEADGYLFGSPTRFGNMSAQMKQLFDSAGPLWMTGAMEGKPAGVFTSTASTHGGQETTIFTMFAPLMHLGTVLVGIPYSTKGLAHTDATGGSPYGASTISGGQGQLQPTESDLFFMRTQAIRVAEIAKKLRG